MWLTFLTPVTSNDPRSNFRPISFVAIYLYMLLNRFRKNPIKHVEEEANCEKKKRKKERKKERKKSQERNKLGDTA